MTGAPARLVPASLPRRGAFLALLAVLFVSASSAHGSCGHYVNLASSSPGQQAEPVHHGAPPPGEAPCHGPLCGRGKQQAPLTPPTVPTAPAEQKALLAAFAQLDDAEDPFGCAPAVPVRAAHRCFPPERPPRA